MALIFFFVLILKNKYGFIRSFTVKEDHIGPVVSARQIGDTLLLLNKNYSNERAHCNLKISLRLRFKHFRDGPIYTTEKHEKHEFC